MKNDTDNTAGSDCPEATCYAILESSNLSEWSIYGIRRDREEAWEEVKPLCGPNRHFKVESHPIA